MMDKADAIIEKLEMCASQIEDIEVSVCQWGEDISRHGRSLRRSMWSFTAMMALIALGVWAYALSL